MKITTKKDHKKISKLRDILLDYILDANRTIPVNNTGEEELEQERYDYLCSVPGIGFEGGIFFHVFTKSELIKKVPKTYPENLDSEGDILTYETYFRNDNTYPFDLNDGTFLVRICQKHIALTDADRLIYQADLGQLKVRSFGVALMAKPVEV